ncbi:hypothetical protein [Longispora urticae]
MSIEEKLAETLAVRAEGEVDTGALLTRSTARGRALRLRRRAGIALAAVAVLGVAVAVPVAVWPSERPRGQFAVPGTTAASPPAILNVLQPPLLPAAPGPSAADDPAVVGSDANLLHLTFDPVLLAPGRSGVAAVASWASRTGIENVFLESLDVNFKAGAAAEQEDLGSNLTPVRDVAVRGRPGKLYSGPGSGGGRVRFALRWEPAPGVVVVGTNRNDATDADLLAAAQALRVDRVTRCASTFGTTGLPAGIRLTGCYINSDSRGPTPTGQLTYTGADGSVLQIRDNDGVPAGQNGTQGDEAPNTTAASRPAYWGPGGQQGTEGSVLIVPDWNGRKVSILVNGSYGRADADRAMAAMTWS